MRGLLRDVTYAVRHLLRSGGFGIAVILILTLGIGITTAVVSTVDHVLFRPLRLPDADRIVTLCEVHRAGTEYCSVSPVNALEWEASAQNIEALGVARSRSIEIVQDGAATPVSGAMASPGFLHALGARALHGRLLDDTDMLPAGSGSVMVLSYELWQDRFGGDVSIIDRQVAISSGGDGRILTREPMTVVGILPPGFDAPRLEGTRAWIPLQIDARAEQHRGWRGFVGVARLRPGVTSQAAAAELAQIQIGLARRAPEHVREWSVQVHGMREWIVRNVRPLLLLFTVAVGVVLAIVCVNVMTLLLARATRRERELTVLAALGAARAQLSRQLLIESLLLTGVGGILGILAAGWLLRGIVLLAPPDIPRLGEIAVDGRIVLLMAGIAMLVGTAVGVIPAARVRYLNLNDVLRQARTSTGGRSQRLRRGLVVTQIALGFALLLSASLLTRSFAHLAAYDPGFDIHGLLTFQVYPPMWRYDTPDRRREFYGELQRRLEAIPGVTAVGSASAGPLFGGGDGLTPFLTRDAPAVALADAPRADWFDAGPGYFPALGVAPTRGRNLSRQPPTGEIREALISESMAQRHWAGTSPVGARLSLPEWEAEVEVVGVVPDLHAFGSTTPPGAAIYVSSLQRPRGASFYVLRTTGDPEAVIPLARSVVAQLDVDVRMVRALSMEQLLRAHLVAPRFNVVLIGAFAVLALLLSTAGLWALIAYTVTLRRREFGIRLALGARAREVLMLVLADSARTFVAGILFGSVGAVWLMRLLRSLIHDVAPTDAAAVAVTVAVLAIAALGAAAGPALRAARTQPASVLHGE